MCLCRIGSFLPLYSISKTEVDAYVGETRRCNFTNSKGTTVALNTFHSPDPKLLISAAYHKTDSYEKSSHSLGMQQLVSSLHVTTLQRTETTGWGHTELIKGSGKPSALFFVVVTFDSPKGSRKISIDNYV